LELEVEGSQLAGVITGKALYEGHLALGELISEVRSWYNKGAQDA
jgi:phosphoribosylformimino-5-aminoimidazole carboxamide ribonucleotide (ProFAR) isomerase